MAAAWVPPPPSYHLRVFAVSLALVAVCLVGFLFGVRLENVVPATGRITCLDIHEVRAPAAGLVEPGWYEGDGEQLPSVPGARFHRLQPGDVVRPGQPLAIVRAEAIRVQVQRLEDEIARLGGQGEAVEKLKRELGGLRQRWRQGVLRAPDTADSWLVLEVPVTPLEKVEPGDLLATLAPADPQTRQPTRLVARLDVAEKHWGGVAVGQTVRLWSNVSNPRLHGAADAVI
ncbi:MAG: HlyD family secretion protein, partial [Planctomycetia bacterium]|nr:HlyD family secretion protein [Planctomycetia bacterium]